MDYLVIDEIFFSDEEFLERHENLNIFREKFDGKALLMMNLKSSKGLKVG